MKGNPEVIKILERALDAEARAIMQYGVDQAIFDNMALGVLAKQVEEVKGDERKHMDKFLARLIFLEESPRIEIDHGSTQDPLPRQASPKEILAADLILEMEAVALYTEGCRTCLGVADYASFALFNEILTDEQDHVNYLEGELDLIAMMDEALYIQSKMGA